MDIRINSFIIILNVFIKLSRSIEEENGLTGIPDIICNHDTIEMNFRTKKRFTGKIYVQGHHKNPECYVDFSKTDKNGKPSAGIKLSHGVCDMDRQRTISSDGMQFSTVLVISFHPLFNTKMDRAFQVKCSYQAKARIVDSEMEVSSMITETIEHDIPMPICTYSIRKSSVDGPILKYALVGDQVFHRWDCNTDSFGILIHSCYAEDGQGTKQMVIDEHGCEIDKEILGDPIYTPNLNMAYREGFVFKFADQPPLCYSEIESDYKNLSEHENVINLKRQKRDILYHHNGSNISKNVTLDGDLFSQHLYVLDNDAEMSAGDKLISALNQGSIITEAPICLSYLSFSIAIIFWTLVIIFLGTVSKILLTLYYKKTRAISPQNTKGKTRRKHLHEYGEKIYGPKGYPLIGNGHLIPHTSFEMLFFLQGLACKAIEKGENLMRIWHGETLHVYPLNGETVSSILEDNTELTKGKAYDFLLPWLGRGLLLSVDEKWRTHRKLLTPTFHFSMLDGFFEVFNQESRNLVEILEKYADNKQEVDIYPLAKYATLDIICETSMGTQLNAQGDPNQPYVKAAENYMRLMFEYNFNFWNWIPGVWKLTGKEAEQKGLLKTLLGFTQQVVKERSEIFDELKASGQVVVNKRMAFLDMLLNMKGENQLTIEDVREEVDTFMFAGHDTTSAAIGWACWCLATHPEIQERVYQEISKHFDDFDREISKEDLNELKYFDRCIKEAMRIFPPVPVITRKLKNDFNMSGKLVPKNAMIVILPYLIHHNEKIYPNHNCYDPDNFLPENINKRHHYSYIPFSAGPRNCIGQKFANYEARVILIWILRKFRLTTDYKLHDNKPGTEAILRPKLGIPLKLHRRY
uniref:ZP domain-containing protein n=1 Tax=Acrobeloides nanus TaxID=290746 RepID=A0A914E9Y2_9BILA